jgi:L-ascorbate metabolism protein UlaG (beta-lactamase superfamily)
MTGRAVALFLSILVLMATPAAAQSSRCQAIADAAPPVFRTAFVPTALEADQVSITFVGHSTFLVESPGGVIVATDYAGYSGGVVPTAVTMNHAHTTHYTDNPDPGIKYVLRGWNPEGDGPAQHNVDIGDVKIRNVTTDIRRWGAVEPDGNSIFIFEVANLCIGHLGHLHHELGPEHVGWIGRLDIVMVPVDGSYTMAQASMINVLKLLRARLVLPMHYFGPTTLARFVDGMRGEFEVEVSPTNNIIVSEAALPETPKVLVLPGY